MPAILSNYLPSLFSSAHARLRKDKHRVARYFNRPKYLLAPEPSTLVQPPWILSKNLTERDYHPPNTTQTTLVTSGRTSASMNLGSLLPVTLTQSRMQHIDNVWTRGSKFRENILTCKKLPVSPIPNRRISFPLPPTLADILRMEPDLSPTSAVLRASDVRMAVAIPSATNIGRHSNLTETSGVRNIQTELINSPCFPCKVVPKSPIKFPGLPAHSPGFQLGTPHSFSGREGLLDTEWEFNVIHLPSSLSSSSPSCDVCALFGIASDEASDRALAEWVCDYLYAVVSRDSYHKSWDTSHDGYIAKLAERAADHIHEIIFSARLHSTTVFLALWYIAQFPVGLVEFVNISEQYQGSLSVEDIIVQTFVVGSMLATKWLNDCTFSARDWHRIASLPLKLYPSSRMA